VGDVRPDDLLVLGEGEAAEAGDLGGDGVVAVGVSPVGRQIRV
jgi:hypothetical protein